MTRHDAAILAIRLAAIYAWFQSVEYIAGGVISLFFAQSKAFGGVSVIATLVYILPCVAMLAAGFFLWLRARALAHYFIAADSETVTYALPRIVSECITLLRSEHFTSRNATPEFLQHLPSLAGTFLQLVFGFLLFVRPHKLAGWWERKRDSNVSV